MTMVTGKLIGPSDPTRVEVTATLVDVTGARVVGYVASLEGEVVRPVRITPASDGTWSADLVANALVESPAGDTLWEVMEGRALDGTPVVTHILVPEAGEWWVGDVRVALSDGPTEPGAVVFVPGPPGAAGVDGAEGASAYDIWLAAGNIGTEAEFLASLQGTDGVDGAPGPARPGLLTTVGQPDNTIGIDGDWALDAGARRLYGPKTAGAWTPWLHIPPPTEPGWQLNGFAALTGTDLYLTHAADGFGSGTCWRTSLEPADGLDVTFECEMSGGTGADGITFALADPADTAATFQGGGGGELGLVGCTSLAVAFDTGAGSRARIVTTSPTTMTTVATYGGTLALRAAPVLVRVRYAAGAISVWADSVLLFDQVPAAVPESVRVGWTGSNGGANDDHIVRNVKFVVAGGIEL
jgi:hypothetical protein